MPYRQFCRRCDGAAVGHHQIVDFVHRSGGGILNRQDAVVGPAFPHRSYDIREGFYESEVPLRCVRIRKQQSRSLVGIGTRASGTYDARMLPCFKKHVLRAAECLAQCAARSKPAVLKGTGHVHHGGKYHCRRITVGAGVLPHPVEYLLLACGIEHRHPVRRFVGGHLSRTIHAPAEQLQHLVVNPVNFLADFG